MKTDKKDNDKTGNAWRINEKNSDLPKTKPSSEESGKKKSVKKEQGSGKAFQINENTAGNS